MLTNQLKFFLVSKPSLLKSFLYHLISIPSGHLLRLSHLYRMGLLLHFNLVFQLPGFVFLSVAVALLHRASEVIELLPSVHVLIENCVELELWDDELGVYFSICCLVWVSYSSHEV